MFFAVMCIVQGHNKHSCRRDIHAIPLTLNVKQASFDYRLPISSVRLLGEMKTRSYDCKAVALTLCIRAFAEVLIMVNLTCLTKVGKCHT